MDERTDQKGLVYLVGSGPGDPGLFTVKGAEILSSSDVILHDELVLLDLINRYANPNATILNVGGKGREKQREIYKLIKQFTDKNKSVVRLKLGDPFIFGRGAEEIEFLQTNHIPYPYHYP